MRESWQSYELDLINYQNKCKIIRGWDDLFNKVKEHINSVAAMKLSPYYKVSNVISLQIYSTCVKEIVNQVFKMIFTCLKELFQMVYFTAAF